MHAKGTQILREHLGHLILVSDDPGNEVSSQFVMCELRMRRFSRASRLWHREPSPNPGLAGG